MNSVIEKLTKINNYEKTLKIIDTRGKETIDVKLKENSIFIRANGINLMKRIDRPLIHQIGSRIWKENDYSKIFSKWKMAYKSPMLFSNTISETLRTNDLRIKYTPKGYIYGIVTPQFHEVDPIDFRETLIKDLNKLLPIEEIENSIAYNKYGEVEESFNLFWDKSDVKLDSLVKINLGIVYGLNNGYSSFRIKLIREILKCKNGLTEKIDNSIQWKHTKKISLEDFSKKSLNHVYSHHIEMAHFINQSKEKELDNKLEQEFFRRLHIIKAAKDRVKERLKIEIKNDGKNEWALSQSLTNIGTHFYTGKGNKNNRDILINTGTHILENNLLSLLEEKPILINTQYGKSYGNMLPMNYLSNN